jgi:hypothetical protein
MQVSLATVPLSLLGPSILGSEPSVFTSAVKKVKNYNIQDDNFACRSVWV